MAKRITKPLPHSLNLLVHCVLVVLPLCRKSSMKPPPGGICLWWGGAVPLPLTILIKLLTVSWVHLATHHPSSFTCLYCKPCDHNRIWLNETCMTTSTVKSSRAIRTVLICPVAVLTNSLPENSEHNRWQGAALIESKMHSAKVQLIPCKPDFYSNHTVTDRPLAESTKHSSISSIEQTLLGRLRSVIIPRNY